jgi:hypothetical protein
VGRIALPKLIRRALWSPSFREVIATCFAAASSF